jgi:hypothetical protein
MSGAVPGAGESGRKRMAPEGRRQGRRNDEAVKQSDHVKSAILCAGQRGGAWRS